MTSHIDELKSLHTTLIDARNGYLEALKNAQGKGLSPLFRDMLALHQSHADALADLLGQYGERVTDSGSLLSTIHRAVINVRALFGGLSSKVLPGLIDGERRIVQHYDDALVHASPSDYPLLTKQRVSLASKVAEMEAQNDLVA